MDYTHDALMSGRKFRTLNLMDGYTREALAIEVDTSLPGLRVARVLEGLSQERGVKLNFIRPGKPTDNGRIESFNRKFRDECLNQFWFVNLAEARERIEAWRQDYNQQRSHSSLGYQTPAEFAARAARGAWGRRPSPSQNQSQHKPQNSYYDLDQKRGAGHRSCRRPVSSKAISRKGV